MLQGGPGTAAAMGMSYDEMVEKVFKSKTLTGELNTVEQVAAVAVLLASEDRPRYHRQLLQRRRRTVALLTTNLHQTGTRHMAKTHDHEIVSIYPFSDAEVEQLMTPRTSAC